MSQHQENLSHSVIMSVRHNQVTNQHFSNMSPRMPGERPSIRGTSEVGRFPGAAPPTRVELTIHKAGERKQDEGGCRRWFRKMCPCCCKRQNSHSYDITDKVELVKPPTPAPEPVKPKPENGEAKEMEGTVADVWSVNCSMKLLGRGSAQLSYHDDPS